jgi:hypothetical protein
MQTILQDGFRNDLDGETVMVAPAADFTYS